MKLQTALLVSILTALVPARAAWAGPATLKKVQITDGSRVDLLFDGKVSPQQIRTEFFNDIIQVSLTDVSVYPAKINSVSGAELTKVFAYQYAPKLTRCRLSVKGSADSYKDRFEVKAEGKLLSLRVQPKGVAKEDPKRDPELQQDKALLDRVMNAEKSANAIVAAPAAAAPASAAVSKSSEPAPPAASSKSQVASQSNEARSASWSSDDEQAPISVSRKSLGGAKPLPSPLRSLAMLGVVLCLFVAGAWGYRKLRGVKTPPLNAAGLGGILAKLGGSKGKMIEVVANHYLGPKKSISVVRIGGRLLVLGVTNESINLITQIGSDGSLNATQGVPDDASAFDLEALAQESDEEKKPMPQAQAARRYSQGAGATSAGAPQFAQMVGAETTKPAIQASASGVRSQIRSRLEGMKQL